MHRAAFVMYSPAGQVLVCDAVWADMAHHRVEGRRRYQRSGKAFSSVTLARAVRM
jgi:hypothetical protein